MLLFTYRANSSKRSFAYEMNWHYGALKYIALYILMVILFMTFVYWYPGEKVMNTNRHFLMIQNSLHQYHLPWQK